MQYPNLTFLEATTIILTLFGGIVIFYFLTRLFNRTIIVQNFERNRGRYVFLATDTLKRIIIQKSNEPVEKTPE